MISREIGAADRARWEEFLGRRENGNLRQSFAWGQIKSVAGWEPVGVLAEEAGQIRAAILMLKKRVPGLGRSILYGCRGPALDWQDGEAAGALVSGIRKAARRHRAILLRIDPEPYQTEVLLPELARHGFRRVNHTHTGWNRTLYELRVMLDLDEDKLFMRMRRNARQNITRAYREGLTISGEPRPDDAETFFRLMSGLESRKYAIKHPFAYYKKVLDEIVGSGLGLLLKAIYQGEVTAAVLLAFLGPKCWAVYLADDQRFRHLAPNKVLLWEGIKLAKSRDCAYFDMGATQGADFEHDSNLDFYKTAYRPEVVKFPGYFDLVFSPLLYALFEFSQARLVHYIYKFKTMRGSAQTASAGQAAG